MFFTATVEGRNGDALIVQSEDNEAVGEMLANLFIELSNYCNGKNSQWVAVLEPFLDKDLCEIVKPLLDAFYSGNWDYSEDEYQFFMKRIGDLPITEEEFKESVRDIRAMWEAVNTLHDVAARLLEAFQKAKPDPVVPLYESPHTENELRALLKTLQLLIDRGVKEARIAFI